MSKKHPNHHKYHLSGNEPQDSEALVEVQEERPVLLKHYIIGFISSLILTLVAYIITINHVADRNILFIILALLALGQFLLQMFYFLHVGREFSPKFKLLMASFMSLVVIILVGGSLWIMFNLDGRVMPTQSQMVKYMNSQNSL